MKTDEFQIQKRCFLFTAWGLGRESLQQKIIRKAHARIKNFLYVEEYLLAHHDNCQLNAKLDEAARLIALFQINTKHFELLFLFKEF